MARQKNTKTHNIFLIDKNKLPGISGVPAPSIADVLATLTTHTVGKNITTVFPTVDEFLSCMKNNQIRYIIAIRPTNKRLLNNTSNIAKHCLNALILRCFEQGIELRIQVL